MGYVLVHIQGRPKESRLSKPDAAETSVVVSRRSVPVTHASKSHH